MAARLSPRALLLLGAALVVAAACDPGSRGPIGGPPATPRVTPISSYSPQMAGTVSLLESALAAEGIVLRPPTMAYQPAEPASITAVPRAVLQADLGDPTTGFVAVYEFVDAATAASGGAQFADYLESGFGQTNYPLDARFSLTQIGATLVFTWWSPERSADRDRAARAFDAIAAVGIPIPIVK